VQESKGQTRDIDKIIIAGDGAVGKTTILSTFLEDDRKIKPTVGVNIHSKRVALDDNVAIELQFWDLSGQPAFSQVRHSFFRDSTAAILVYDVTDISTLKNLDNWIAEIEKANDGKTKILGILGNKIDLKQKKEVTKLFAEGFVKKFNKKYDQDLIFAECSGKENTNVKKTFKTLLLKLIKQKNN